MHRIKILLAAVLCLAILSGCSSGGSELFPSELDSYYYDGVGVLSENTREHINYSNQDLNDKTGAEVIIACIETTGLTDIADVAYDMFNTWKIGDENESNGVLLLISTGEQDYWCLQGEGLEKVLSSGRLKTLTTEYLEPYIQQGDYDGGALSMFNALIGELEAAYSIAVDPDTGWNWDYGDEYYEEEGLSFFELVVGLIVIGWCLSILVGRKKNGREHSTVSKLIAYDILKDTLRHMSDSDHRGGPRGGGGFSGGFSGGSRGGGFRGRTGGGGRSRGGGAGRR